MLIRAYRMRGHFHAKLDPLGIEAGARPRRARSALLRLHRGRFRPQDLPRSRARPRIRRRCARSSRSASAPTARRSASSSCTSPTRAQKAWIQERIEGPDKEISFTREGPARHPDKLIEAEGFEKFCDVKFTGTKRFGLDGAESLIPALEQIIKRGGNLGVKEIVVGMPHRGRLNVLTQVMGKPHRALFHEFKGGSANPDAVEGSGDVKYHLGASSDREFDNNKIHLSLTANPSHLEIVDPVVLGKVRAKQDQHGDPPDMRISVLPMLMHGDAAFAGQGVVAECFALSDLKGYRTGGSLHFIVNNQIGFTTYPRYSRSSPYPSDVAKMIDAPIFHVNGDDPEAVVFAAKVAIEFRQKFHKPVVIDMFCYRRHGHNEGDEPAFTQPVMYKRIATHPGTVEIYSKRLIAEGVMTEGEVEKAKADWRARLDAELEAGSGYKPNKADWLDGKWAGFKSADQEEDAAPRRHRRRCRRAQGYRPQDHQGARRLPGSPHHPALPGKSRQGDRQRRRHRLGDRRGAGVLHADAGRPSRPAVGTGLRARHLLAAPFGADRSGRREPLHAVQSSRRRSGPLRGHQLAAVGRGGARLRVRLFAGGAEGAGDLGSPVRRFRQRRAGAVRPVHLLGRAQMAAHVRPRLPAAAWL